MVRGSGIIILGLLVSACHDTSDSGEDEGDTETGEASDLYDSVEEVTVSTDPVEEISVTTDPVGDPDREVLSDQVGRPPIQRSVQRGGSFMGGPERFNRYYTDPDWQPSRVIYVSRDGAGSGTSADDPTSVDQGFSAVGAGEEIRFLSSDQTYRGCWELDEETSGTYDAPIVLQAERGPNNERGVHIECCDSGRSTCFNLEGADYVAVEGFVFEGGRYGIRSVGSSFESAGHQRGIAMLDNEAFDQCADPLFTGQSDWIVVEGNSAHGAGDCDGHGIYLSNGSDWMIVRHNNLYENTSSDFQINADPAYTCEEEGIAYDDPRCDGLADDGLGQGVSDYVLVENNYFHNGFRGRSSGPNFTSVRNSVVRNNVFGFYDRHGTSFWQETTNPRLGSSDNVVHHNLFIGESSSHVLQFNNYSDRNDVRNNIFLGIELSASSAVPNRSVALVEVDTDTISENVFENNYYVSGRFDGHSPSDSDFTNANFDTSWFEDFPLDRMGTIEDYRPTEAAPFLELGQRSEGSPVDASGGTRPDTVDLGPFEQ